MVSTTGTKMRVLLTGCCGYVGSVLCNQLVNMDNIELVGVDNLMYNNAFAMHHLLGHPKFSFAKADVRDLPTKLLKNADIVIHLAAIVGEKACRHNGNSQSVNVEATNNLVNRLSSNQRLLFASEASSVEKESIEPLSAYSKQKGEAECIALNHGNAVSLRLATVFGVSPRMRMDLLVNDFVAKAHFDRHISLYEPYFNRNAVHVRDVSRSFIWMLDPQYNGIYNVADETCNLTKTQLAVKIFEKLNISSSIAIIDNKDIEQKNCSVNSSKLLRTGFRYKFTLESGIEEVRTLCYYYNRDELRRMSNAWQYN